MKAVWQRVKEARVEVDSKVIAEIGLGALVLLGVEQGDSDKDVKYIADKCAGLRVFEDDQGKMNLSLKDVGGSILLVSQFTLCGDCRKGRRPSFVKAARPEEANLLYEQVADGIRHRGVPVKTGRFQAMMDVYLINHGPVTLLLDSRR